MIPDLYQPVTVTELIDGLPAYVVVNDCHEDDLVVGSTLPLDDMGFKQWVKDNADALKELGDGQHSGVWWGEGIGRGYGLSERRFTLTNPKYSSPEGGSWYASPILVEGYGESLNALVETALWELRITGSYAAPGFDLPAGVIVHHASGARFKVTLEGDGQPKSLAVTLKQKSGMDSPLFSDAYNRFDGNPIGLAKFVTSVGEPVTVG